MTIGTPRFVLLYSLAGLASSLAVILLYRNSDSPFIGASGAVYGVLGGYFLLLPAGPDRTKTIIWTLALILIPALIPAHIIRSITGSDFLTNIAHWGHVGGFLVGILTMYLMIRHGAAAAAQCLRDAPTMLPTESSPLAIVRRRDVPDRRRQPRPPAPARRDLSADRGECRGLPLHAHAARGEHRDLFVAKWSVIPARFIHYAAFQQANPQITSPLYLTLVTAMFLHGGWLHIGGNMLFLWVFGDNVEDAMGPVRFIVYYLVCGLAGNFAHIYFNQSSLAPSLGASGAIAGRAGRLHHPAAARAGTQCHLARHHLHPARPARLDRDRLLVRAPGTQRLPDARRELPLRRRERR